LKLTASSTRCGPNDLPTSRATRLEGVRLDAPDEEGEEDTGAPALGSGSSGREGFGACRLRYIERQDSPVTPDDRPDFSRLELDEDGELVRRPDRGARHAATDSRALASSTSSWCAAIFAGCDFSEAEFHRYA